MNKLLRATFIGLLLFVFLYFFGDIRINDLNIRDYLQSTVTLQNLIVVKHKCEKIYMAVRGIVDTEQETAKDLITPPQLDKTQKAPTLPRLAEKQIQTPKTERLDALTLKDRERLKNLLEQHLNNPPKDTQEYQSQR